MKDFESSYSCCGRQLCFITPTCKEDEVKKENPQKFGISIYTILLYPLFQNRVDNLTNGVKLFAKNYSDWSAMTLNDILSRFDNLLEQEFRKAQSKKKKKKIPVQWQTWWHRFIFNSFLLSVFQQLTGIVANDPNHEETNDVGIAMNWGGNIFVLSIEVCLNLLVNLSLSW